MAPAWYHYCPRPPLPQSSTKAPEKNCTCKERDTGSDGGDEEMRMIARGCAIAKRAWK